jgi:hypothetical protein
MNRVARALPESSSTYSVQKYRQYAHVLPNRISFPPKIIVMASGNPEVDHSSLGMSHGKSPGGGGGGEQQSERRRGERPNHLIA